MKVSGYRIWTVVGMIATGRHSSFLSPLLYVRLKLVVAAGEEEMVTSFGLCHRQLGHLDSQGRTGFRENSGPYVFIKERACNHSRSRQGN